MLRLGFRFYTQFKPSQWQMLPNQCISRIRTRTTLLSRPFNYEHTSAQLIGNFVGIVNKNIDMCLAYT